MTVPSPFAGSFLAPVPENPPGAPPCATGGRAPAAGPHTKPPLQGPQTFRIADLLCVPEFQFRSKLNTAAIKRYAKSMERGAVFDPIKVAMVDGVAMVVDGFHRIAATKRRGCGTINAEVVTATREEAAWLAARANLANGLPVKARDMRPIFGAYVRARENRNGRRLKSYRDMATDLSGWVSASTLRTWMRRDFPALYRRMGKENDHASGGCHPRKAAAGASFAAITMDALENASTAFAAVKGEEARGKVIQRTEEVLAAMKAAGGFVMPVPWGEERDDSTSF
jgi:hypothetical protein